MTPARAGADTKRCRHCSTAMYCRASGVSGGGALEEGPTGEGSSPRRLVIHAPASSVRVPTDTPAVARKQCIYIHIFQTFSDGTVCPRFQCLAINTLLSHSLVLYSVCRHPLGLDQGPLPSQIVPFFAQCPSSFAGHKGFLRIALCNHATCTQSFCMPCSYCSQDGQTSQSAKL